MPAWTASQLADHALRDELVRLYREHPDAAVRRRCHVVMLSKDGLTNERIQKVVYASRVEVEIILSQFRAGGVEALLAGELTRRRE